MKTDYNQISIEYQLSKLQPWRKHVEAYTFFTLLGDVSNRSVLDLACGDGFYTRQLKLRGAAKVVGVDVSEKMIELAEKAEEKNPLGIDYIVQDVIGLRLGQTFDLISAAYLLNYAKTFEELIAFAKSISIVSMLKPNILATDGRIAIRLGHGPCIACTTRPLIPQMRKFCQPGIIVAWMPLPFASARWPLSESFKEHTGPLNATGTDASNDCTSSMVIRAGGSQWKRSFL